MTDAPATSAAEAARTLVPRGPVPDVAVRSSVERGRSTVPGIQQTPFMWPDLDGGPPPRRRGRGEGAYAIYHDTEIGNDHRVTYMTVISVDPGPDADHVRDDTIHVDARLMVEKRLFLELIDRERAFTDRVTSKWRAGLAKNLAMQRTAVGHLHLAWVIAVLAAVIRFEARVGHALINVFRGVMRGAVGLPDALATRIQRAQGHLGTRLGRRLLRKGIFEPVVLNTAEKGVMFFLALATLGAIVLFLNTLVTLLTPENAGAYRNLLTDASLMFLGVLWLPYIVEPAIALRAANDGPVAALAGHLIGKAIGVWLLYFVGESLYETVKKATKGRPRVAKAVAWSQANADKHGFALLFLLNSLPLMPDLLLYVFALSGMRYKTYMGGIMAGTLVKFGAIVIGVEMVGPDKVTAFFADPFGAF
ncbi:MAG TPA: VTT domain-containing protein [Candidatus Thermoplasmatota archaeon]|nr:VTT domain-containing protein [Candidatus Thermoplasmatota archaeon]